jgi:hypothetical protein
VALVRLARAALAALLVASPVLARAQSPAERTALDRLCDSLDSQTDTAALTRALDALGRKAAREPTAFDELRHGLVALRRAELRPADGAGAAIKHLRRASRLEPGWPWAWYALGMAETVRAAWEQRNRLALGSRVGVGTLERAAERQQRALEADPAFVPAARTLADLTLGLRDTALVVPALLAVRRAIAASRRAPHELILAWGRLERAADSLTAARAVFSRYLESGGHRALGLLERARTELALGLDGAEAG